MGWDGLRVIAAKHRYKILGGVGGFLFALLVIRVGIWWTLFIILCAGTGYWIGTKLDEDPENLVRILDRLLPPGGR